MFGKLIDAGHSRNLTEATVFYITSLILLVGFSTVLMHVLGLVGVVNGGGTFFEGGSWHTLIGTGFILVLSSMILTGRKLTSDIFSILLVILGVYLGYTTSIMLGMIPVALLTTMKK